MHTYICTHTYIHMHTHRHASTYVCIHIYTYVHTYTYMHILLQTQTYTTNLQTHGINISGLPFSIGNKMLFLV